MNSTSVTDNIEQLFPYNSYRSGQLEGMKQVYETVSEDGYVIEEGACGTGKTLLALTPLASKLRDESQDIDRIIVITKVNQQQEVFQEEIQKINKSLREQGKDPIMSLTLTGKQNVCPYVKQGEIDSYDIQNKCSSLRESTRNIAKSEDSSADKAKSLASDSRIKSETDVFTSGLSYPYPKEIPEEEGVEFCPFYAEYIGKKYQLLADEEDPLDVIPQKLLDMGLITEEDLLEQAGEKDGMCPHSIMNDSIEEAELIIANYKHLFHQQTVEAMTEPILDDSTAIVVDEGHNMVPQVRQELSQSVTVKSFQNAISEAQNILKLLSLSVQELKHLKSKSESNLTEEESQKMEDVNSLLSSSKLFHEESDLIKGVKELEMMNLDSSLSTELTEYISFLQSVESAINKVAEDLLEDELGHNWVNKDTTDEFRTSLRPEPETPSQDRISQWMDLSNNKDEFINAKQVGTLISELMEQIVSEVSDDDRTIKKYSDTVGRFLKNWAERDNTQYFREFEFTERKYSDNIMQGFEFGWQNEYQLEMHIRNCIPREDISSRLSNLGGGIIMSATLSPVDVFVEESGLSLLQEDGIPIETNVDGLSFPEENRESLVVESAKFKYANKGDRTDVHGYPNVSNPVREEYKDLIIDTVEESEGNIMVAMPSYPEAEWAAQIIKKYSSISEKNVLVDESSENWETEQLKQKFFSSGKKVLTTGARGTLTEGVNYEGDKLNGVLVCGVPIEQTRSDYKQAIKAAYVDEFGRSNGFDYAFTVPAVRKARQAIGRVIRDTDEKGIRILADERYSSEYTEWDSVHDFLAEYEKEEFESIQSSEVKSAVEGFWESVN